MYRERKREAHDFLLSSQKIRSERLSEGVGGLAKPWKQKREEQP